MKVPHLTFIYDRKKRSNKNRKGLVELCIGNGRNRRWYSTGVNLYPREWDNGSVVGREDWVELNNQLQALKRKCAEIITKMMDEGKLDIGAIPNLLKERMIVSQTFIDYAKERAEERYAKIAPGTREHYELFFRFLEKWKGIVHFTDVTEKNIMKMDRYLGEHGLKEVSRWSYHKMLKTFIIQAIEDGNLKRNPYTRLNIKRGGDDGLKRFLTPDEFHRFETCIIPTESLRRVRDLFVFQTYTMLSYQDLEVFDYRKCVKMDGMVIYRAKRRKTGQDFTIALIEPALVVLQRYGYKLPIISNVKYNLYLKAAVVYAKIDKPVTTHWARHTGATMLLNEGGIPMHVIQHILGHASLRETEKTYAKLMDETIVETMVKYQSRKTM
jgi:integrase